MIHWREDLSGWVLKHHPRKWQATPFRSYRYKTLKNINILNWKNYKLPARGKITYLDDVMKYERKRGVPECKFDLPDWKKEKNSMVTHGISTKDAFHNKSPRILMNDMIAKE